MTNPRPSSELNNLTPRFEDALVFAFQLHHDQRRKSSDVPYVAHLLAVTSLVLEDGGSEEEAIAALLHDAVEDQGGRETLALIQHRYGSAVAEIVDDVSDCDSTPKPPWKERKETYLKRLLYAPNSARRVSLADKLHNLRDILFTYRQIGEKTWERFKGGKEGTLWYYSSLVTIFEQTGNDPMTQELRRVYDDLSNLVSLAANPQS
jgi:(p)ppGpp synthase/HD superfamily hydrolase